MWGTKNTNDIFEINKLLEFRSTAKCLCNENPYKYRSGIFC